MTEPPTAGRFDGAGITLCVTGSVAAYKAAMVARLLVKEGALVQTILTRAAKQFIGAATFGGITGNPVLDDMWDPTIGGEIHVDLASDSDVVLIVPATADTLSRMASGRADDLVTALALSATCPIVAAPAMHPNMWSHPATRRNIETIARDARVTLVGPTAGEVASGDVGLGRMSEPEQIVDAVASALSPPDLEGMRIVVTAGPTVEDIDPVRFVGNRSTGKMGFAVAERAAARGAEVRLIAGPVALPTPRRAQRVDVRSALEMQTALDEALGAGLAGADAVIMTAAVGDYRPKQSHDQKLKRAPGETTLELVANPDLLATIGERRTGTSPLLVGFALETADGDELVELARGKLRKKKIDLVVANHARDSFGRDDNRATLVTEDAAEPLGSLSKRALADAILDRVAAQRPSGQ